MLWKAKRLSLDILNISLKSKQRKKLEMQAMILGVTVTYGNDEPNFFKEGDRWYEPISGKYHVANSRKNDFTSLILGISSWYSVGSKRFFNLSDIKK